MDEKTAAQNGQTADRTGEAMRRAQNGPASGGILESEVDSPVRRWRQSGRLDGERDNHRTQQGQPGSDQQASDQAIDRQAIDRMEDEGGPAYNRSTTDEFRRERKREREPETRSRSSWWQREPLTVREIMTTNIRWVALDATLPDVAEIMRQEDVGVVPVVRPDGRLHGLITDRDIVVRALATGKPVHECQAKEIATRDIEAVTADHSISDILDLMGRHQIRRIPVVDASDRLIGIVSIGDIANRADHHQDLQEALEKISGRRSFWSRIWR